VGITHEEHQKQEYYRDARTGGYYGDIWTSVGKCVFCDLRDKYIFHEENGVVMTILLYAYIDGHLMIIPRRHVRSVKELTPAEWETMRKMMYLAKKLIRRTHGIKGMQIIQKDGTEAQSTVEHLHFQCVPFDAPDLSIWNYRQLKHTPLKNAQLYQAARKQIQKYGESFEQKYRRRPQLSVDSDLIIINTHKQILFEERPGWAKIGNDYMSLPGGAIEDTNRTLEQELAREVYEETGLTLDPNRFELVASRIANLTRRQVLDTAHPYDYTDRFLWNTYVYRGLDAKTALTPGDDAQALVWIPSADIASHPRISPAVKTAIAQVAP
jgi:histidine triad (HIT) family protein